MDTLDRLVELASLRGAIDVRCLPRGHWLLEHPRAPAGVAPYHVVLATRP